MASPRLKISRRAVIATGIAAAVVPAAAVEAAAEPITGAVVHRAVPIGILSSLSLNSDGSALLEIISVGDSLRTKYMVTTKLEAALLTRAMEIGQLMGLDRDSMQIVPMGDPLPWMTAPEAGIVVKPNRMLPVRSDGQGLFTDQD